MAGDVGGEVEEVLLLLRRGRELCEIFRRDDDVAGGSGHLALAGPIKWLVVLLSDVEQALSRGGVGFSHTLAVGGDEADKGHMAKLLCRAAASSIIASARTSSSSLV